MVTKILKKYLLDHKKRWGGRRSGSSHAKVSPRLTSRTHFEYIAQFRWVEFYRHRKQFEKH